MEAGRFVGVWRGYYASGAPMWEAAGGWFTGMGTGLEFSEQIRECKEDLKDQDDSDEIDPISSELSEQDQDDDDDHADDMEMLGLLSYDPFPQDDVKLISFWTEDGTQVVESGVGRVRHRVERSLEHNGETYSTTPKIYVAEFIDGVYDGVYREYYGEDLGVEVHYKSGLRHGIERWWFESGKLMSLEQYKDDVQVGMSFKWGWDGRPEKVFKHVDGRMKLLACWDEAGKLTVSNGVGYWTDGVDTVIYFDGEEVIRDEGYGFGWGHIPSWLKKIDIPYQPRSR